MPPRKGSPHPKITKVIGDPCPRILVVWADGTEHAIDLGDFIAAHPTLDPIIQGDRFAAVVPGEWGMSADWGDDQEIPADVLWTLGLEQDAVTFRAWRKAHGLTQAHAAGALGVSTRTITLYETGAQPIPKTITLARHGYDALQRIAA